MIEEGDKVFFCYAGLPSVTGDYGSIAWRAIENLGLIPIVYGNATLDIEKSNLAKEILKDFHESEAIVVLLFGKKQRRENSSVGDNWAIPKLPAAISQGTNCLVCATAEVTKNEIKSLKLPVDVVTVKDEGQFETILRQYLEKAMAA